MDIVFLMAQNVLLRCITKMRNISNSFRHLLVLIKLLHGNLKDCQKTILKLQLHQTIVLLQDWFLSITEGLKQNLMETV